MEVIEYIEKEPNIKICMCWDWCAVGIPAIMQCYFTGLENKYGTYKFNAELKEPPLIFIDYFTLDKVRWTFAAEIQLFEMIFEWLNANHLDINTSLKVIINTELCCVDYTDRYKGWKFIESIWDSIIE